MIEPFDPSSKEAVIAFTNELSELEIKYGKLGLTNNTFFNIYSFCTTIQMDQIMQIAEKMSKGDRK